MGKAPGELDVNVIGLLETDGTGLKQTEPCSGHIDLSTATDSKIIGHFRALVEHREDKEEVAPKFDDDLVYLEPWLSAGLPALAELRVCLGIPWNTQDFGKKNKYIY
jgi:hypothetical protein